MSSTRTELCGLFAALTYVRLVMEYYDLKVTHLQDNFQCILYCDSTAAISRASDAESTYFGTTWRCRINYDLEAAIRTCLEGLPFKVYFEWVKGHADRRKKPEKFTWAEFLNVAADEMATNGRGSSSQPDTSHWPEQVVSVVGPQGRLLGRLGSELRYDCTIYDLRTYYMDRYGWDLSEYELIDEDGLQKALSHLHGGARRRVQQLRCGWLPVNRRVAWMDPDRLCGCAACSPTHIHEETVDHIFQCPARERRAFMLQELEEMKKQFAQWKTDTAIVSAITAGAKAWIEGDDIPSVESLHLPDTEVGRLTAAAYSDQSILGWQRLLSGIPGLFLAHSTGRGFPQSPKAQAGRTRYRRYVEWSNHQVVFGSLRGRLEEAV